MSNLSKKLFIEELYSNIPVEITQITLSAERPIQTAFLNFSFVLFTPKAINIAKIPKTTTLYRAIYRVVQLSHKESNEYRKGDILLLRRCNKYPQGELIAVEAEKGDGATICRLYIDEDVRHAMMTFEDHSMPYLFPLEDLKDIHIFGQVIGVYHPIVK